jgi:V/A-type H+/Na+-transporting ATPase subunit C
MTASARADFDYGNARLRVRKGALLGRSGYSHLLDGDLDGALAALADGAYAPELEVLRGRFSGLRALHEAVRQHLARSLEEMRALYAGSARELVDLLLAKWDLHNLLTLLRGRSSGATAEETLACLVPIGALDQSAAAQAAGQAEAERTMEILVGRRLPSPDLARALSRAWPAYARTQDLAALEHAIVAEHFAGLRAALAGSGEAGAPLARAFERGLDVRNLLAALRLRPGPERAGSKAAPFLAGGSIAPERLHAVVHAAGEAEALAALSGSVRDGGLREILRSWSPDDGLTMLQERLETASARAALKLFISGDPLGLAVPIAFVAAHEAEARNLRLIGESIASGADRPQVAARLLLVGEQTR